MTARTREVVEGEVRQGEDEVIVYTLDVSANGSSPTAVAVEVKNASSNYANVKETVMPTGSPTMAGNVITLPPLRLLTAGQRYRVEVKYTLGNGNTLEDYFRVIAER